eukprot:TRINITY_DN77280_c0_g1_i1.p1 TRINITY_DN77280_c0_g1~~TRINITY_DN77280_c0_g1_i1.p1  ORF type:complete len:141 (+),score=8.43 TRINITY_DN77280_c0_g1_i1:27-425(+)
MPRATEPRTYSYGEGMDVDGTYSTAPKQGGKPLRQTTLHRYFVSNAMRDGDNNKEQFASENPFHNPLHALCVCGSRVTSPCASCHSRRCYGCLVECPGCSRDFCQLCIMDAGVYAERKTCRACSCTAGLAPI